MAKRPDEVRSSAVLQNEHVGFMREKSGWQELIFRRRRPSR
jgi:hypothetical protein